MQFFFLQHVTRGMFLFSSQERQVKLWPGGGTLRATRGRQTQSPEGDSQLTQDNGGGNMIMLILKVQQFTGTY